MEARLNEWQWIAAIGNMDNTANSLIAARGLSYTYRPPHTFALFTTPRSTVIADLGEALALPIIWRTLQSCMTAI